MFITAVSKIANKYKQQPEYTSPSEWVSKSNTLYTNLKMEKAWSLHIIDYYFIVKKKKVNHTVQHKFHEL